MWGDEEKVTRDRRRTPLLLTLALALALTGAFLLCGATGGRDWLGKVAPVAQRLRAARTAALGDAAAARMALRSRAAGGAAGAAATTTTTVRRSLRPTYFPETNMVRRAERSLVRSIFGRWRKSEAEVSQKETVRKMVKWLKKGDRQYIPPELTALREKNEGRRVCIMVNPTSGGRIGLKVLHKTVMPVLKEAGITNISVVETLSRFSVPKQIAETDLGQYDDILCIGGDGTLVGVILGLGEHPAEDAISFPIGLVPCGSHNHMFKVMSGFDTVHRSVEKKHVLASLLRFCRGEKTALPVPKVSADSQQERPFLCGLSFGLLAAAFRTSERWRWTGLRKTRYYASVLWEIFRFKQYRYKVRYLPADSQVQAPESPPTEFSEDWVTENGPYQWFGFSPLSFGVPREEAINDFWGYLMIIDKARTPFGIIRTILKPKLTDWNSLKMARLEKVKAVSIEPLEDDKEWNMDGEKENNFEQVYVRFNQDEVATYVG